MGDEAEQLKKELKEATSAYVDKTYVNSPSNVISSTSLSGHTVSLPSNYNSHPHTISGQISFADSTTVVSVDIDVPTEDMLTQIKSELQERLSLVEKRLSRLSNEYEAGEQELNSIQSKILEIEDLLIKLNEKDV